MRLAAAAVLVLAAPALLAGCSGPALPGAVDVYAEAGRTVRVNGTEVVQGTDGAAFSTGRCTTTASYQTHMWPTSGWVNVTVTDGAGATHRFRYDAFTTDKREIEGAPGLWTVHARWHGFVGSIHAGILC